MAQKGYRHGVVPANYRDTLPAESKVRYLTKIALCGLTPADEPYLIQNDGCALPRLTFGDIYCYLVNKCSFATGDQMKAYKQTKAYEFFVAGNIDLPLNCCELPAPDKVLVRAKVIELASL